MPCRAQGLGNACTIFAIYNRDSYIKNTIKKA
jgi:hypothetical protein